MKIEVIPDRELDSIKRRIAKEFKFKQYRGTNWKIEGGYFFKLNAGIYYLKNELRGGLDVKPYYADRLFWTIMEMDLNINEPDSLRAVGAFAVDSEPIAEEVVDIGSCTGIDMLRLEEHFLRLYTMLDRDVKQFLRDNPDADTFYRPPVNDRHMDLPLVMLCHMGKYRQALEMAERAIEDGEDGGILRAMPDGVNKSDYMFIRDYCLSKIAENG